MMRQIRIVTAGIPVLPQEVVLQVVEAEPDLSVVANLRSARPLLNVVRREAADVVLVWAQLGEFVKAATDLLAAQPSVKVVLLADNGNIFIEARASGSTLGQWPDDLVTTIRRSGGTVEPCTP